MPVEKYISQLLFEHDCVIVPGFGGFVCNYAPAGIQPAKNQFHPPFKKISFNRNLQNNDGLLANQVCMAQNVAYVEANQLILEFVENLNKGLDSAKRFVLTNIGTLYMGEENTILFEQDERVNYLPGSFGLSVFNYPPIKRETIERKFERKLQDKVITPSKQQAGQVVAASRKVPRAILASAAVLLIACMLWLPFQTGLVKNINYAGLNPFEPNPEPLYQAGTSAQPDPDNDATKPDVANMLAMAGKDTVRYLNIVIDGNIPIVVKLRDEPSVTSKAKKKPSKVNNHFHVVGGAFAIPENAEKFLRKLMRDGYNASIIDTKGKNLRFVSYGAFATKEEAMQALDKIRAVQQDAWLMTN